MFHTFIVVGVLVAYSSKLEFGKDRMIEYITINLLRIIKKTEKRECGSEKLMLNEQVRI